MGNYGQEPVAEVIDVALVMSCAAELPGSVAVISDLVFAHWCVLAEEEGLFTYVAAFGVFIDMFLVLTQAHLHVLLHLLQAFLPCVVELHISFSTQSSPTYFHKRFLM